MAVDGAGDDELVFDHLFVRVYKSGRVERLMGTATVPAGHDSISGVTSVDVDISPDVSARLFLPLVAATGDDGSNKKLPVLVYYHGGGFIVESARSPTYVNFLNALCSAAGVLVVSVDYRRAPEHPLPAAYDDCLAALHWSLSPTSHHWLADHADLTTVLLGGDSAGANIVHNILLRGGAEFHPPISAAMLIHPYFWGTTSVGPTGAGEDLRRSIEKLWRLTCPDTSGVDDPRLNPLADAAALEKIRCRRLLICVAEKDFLMEWGWAYYNAFSSWLSSSAAASHHGFEVPTVEMVETKGEGHVFHLMKSESGEAKGFIRRLAVFINSGEDLISAPE